ncbi:hypothetical protein PHJA_001679500 [Phtheirospermum japonicum]|uniref:Uncharacterized protein n=1 Tax=Phtheirospermum japonicum TaxID=374723 RepID=A0A830CAR5_9LAMI|nr:hypothetical protein PHJA_001679500 [Phtheirospermum japonicum]
MAIAAKNTGVESVKKRRLQLPKTNKPLLKPHPIEKNVKANHQGLVMKKYIEMPKDESEL